MKKKIAVGIAALTAAALAGILWFCMTREEPDRGAVIFHVNAEETALVEVPYGGSMDASQESVEQMLEYLAAESGEADTQPAIPADVEVEKISLINERLTLDFNGRYLKMDPAREVLCRAALVRSLTQIAGVDMVAVSVDGELLKNHAGEEYGFQLAEDFVQNTGSTINSYEETVLTLFFADPTGTKLVKETRNVRYNTSLSLERLVVEQLMKGPSTEDCQKVIPDQVKLLGVSVKDGICYVNFDEGVRIPVTGVKPEVTVYAIVNSITSSSATGQVQISVEGETKEKFQESIDISKPLTSNLDILEESE